MKIRIFALIGLCALLLVSGCKSRTELAIENLCRDLKWTDCNNLSIYGREFESRVSERIALELDVNTLVQRINIANDSLINQSALKAIDDIDNQKFRQAIFGGDPFDGVMKLTHFIAGPPYLGCVSLNAEVEKKCKDEGVKISSIHDLQDPFRYLRFELLFIDPATEAGRSLISLSREHKSLLLCGVSASGHLKYAPSRSEDSHSVGWWRVDKFSVAPCTEETLTARLTRAVSKNLGKKFHERLKSDDKQGPPWDKLFSHELESMIKMGMSTTPPN